MRLKLGKLPQTESYYCSLESLDLESLASWAIKALPAHY